MTEITFAQLKSIAKQRGHTQESLADRFRGKIDNPGEFFHRVFLDKFANVVVVYRSVLSFYFEELHFIKDLSPNRKTCACACGQLVFERKKWASPACRKRFQRKLSQT